MDQDTIAAIGTGLCESGIGIVRVSGGEAVEIVDRIFFDKKGRSVLSGKQTHTIHHGWIRTGEGEILDEVLVMLMRGPRTFTGEDTVEINCHGGVMVLKKVLERVLEAGARLAEPGEFTKRAFLNGKMDLARAEAVMDVIASENDYALRSSLDQMNGSLSGRVKEIRADILRETARIEAALDDPEHMSLDGYGDILQGKIEDIIKQLDRLIATADEGRLIREGILTVILGRPNAGKSSLMNLLAGQERAIVTQVPGTTRDVLEEKIRLRDISLRVMDTAGIRTAGDEVEKIGVEKAKKYASEADLILYVVDSSLPLGKEDEEIWSLISGKKGIILFNKSDLPQALSPCELSRRMESFCPGEHFPLIVTSAREKKGLEELSETVEAMFFSGGLSRGREPIITNLRHKEALCQARDSMLLVKESVGRNMPEDFYSIDLMDACACLGRITGEEAGEDLIREIFSRFCMGK